MKVCLVGMLVPFYYNKKNGRGTLFVNLYEFCIFVVVCKKHKGPHENL